MFHFAEPEDAGSGVTIWIPGLIRSSQPLIPFGLPGRTTITTTESEMIPLVGPVSQPSATFDGTSLDMSEPTEKLTKSAFWPLVTAVAWVPLAPYEGVILTPLPSLVLANAVASASYAGLGTE